MQLPRRPATYVQRLTANRARLYILKKRVKERNIPFAEDLPTDPRKRALALQEYYRRELFIKKKATEARKQLQHGRKMPSSFIEELIYQYEEHIVNARFNDKWYSFFNVPPSIFNAWWKGGATCLTDDTRKEKRWIIGKHPSLGAFYNTYIKGRYPWIRGKV